MSNNFNIGIDFGGVLSSHDDGNNEHRNTHMDMPFALDILKQLKQLKHNLYLISFCGKSRANETKESIKMNNASELFNDQFYVKKREYKREVCDNLGCHFMIDDSVENLDHISSTNKKIVTILFGQSTHSYHKCASDWNDVLSIISKTPYFEQPHHETKLHFGYHLYKT
jgi:hypothetical protein